MHIQQLAVIIAFNEELLDKFISLLAIVPFVGAKFQEPLKRYFIEQKHKLHDKSSMVIYKVLQYLLIINHKISIFILAGRNYYNIMVV